VLTGGRLTRFHDDVSYVILSVSGRVTYVVQSPSRALADHGLIALARRCPSANLLHEQKQVSDAPMVCDLSVLDSHHIN